MIEPELRRIVQLLERLARVNKVPNRTIERQAGFAHGTLNRLFAGKMDLKMRHVLAILQAVGMAVPEFFLLAYSKGMENASPEQAFARMEALSRAAEEPPAAPLTREEVEALVFETLERIERDKKQRRGKPKS